MTTRDNPFSELERLFERMQRNVEDAARRWDTGTLPSSSEAASVKVDLADAGDELVLTADLPGFDPDDIEVRVSGRTLHVAAERESETETETDAEGDYYRRERHRASVSRSLTLPEDVDESDVSAQYRNGVLTVRMPKTEPAEEGTRIEVA